MNTLSNKTLKEKIKNHIGYIGLERVCDIYNGLSYEWKNEDRLLVLYSDGDIIAELFSYSESTLFLTGLLTGITCCKLS